MPDPPLAPLAISPPATLPRAGWRIWLARAVAVAADILEIGVFPVFIPGATSPMTDVVDIVVAILLTVLVGWHIAFVPSFLIKLLPIADLAPTWTVAIAIATWRRKIPARQNIKRHFPFVSAGILLILASVAPTMMAMIRAFNQSSASQTEAQNTLKTGVALSLHPAFVALTWLGIVLLSVGLFKSSIRFFKRSSISR